MASMSNLTKIICMTLTIFACSCNALELIWGLNSELNALCPQENGASEVGVPDECNVNNFIMCFNGQAIAINICGTNERFNRQKNGCDFIEQVILPKSCKEITKPAKKVCGEPGVSATVVEDSCKFYMSCTTSGGQRMPCNPKAYFIESQGRCMFITEGFKSHISREELEACEAKDPYTAQELAQR